MFLLKLFNFLLLFVFGVALKVEVTQGTSPVIWIIKAIAIWYFVFGMPKIINSIKNS